MFEKKHEVVVSVSLDLDCKIPLKYPDMKSNIYKQNHTVLALYPYLPGV